jgi:hypothetical protein
MDQTSEDFKSSVVASALILSPWRAIQQRNVNRKPWKEEVGKGDRSRFLF